MIPSPLTTISLIRALAQALHASFPARLIANVLGKAAAHDPLGFLPIMQETQTDLLASGWPDQAQAIVVS